MLLGLFCHFCLLHRESNKGLALPRQPPNEKNKIEIGHHARTQAGIGHSACWHALHRHCSQLPMRYAEPLSHGACRHQELVVNEGYTGGGGTGGRGQMSGWGLAKRGGEVEVTSV